MTPDWGNYGTYNESAHPDLWNGIIGYWGPCLGPTGLRLHDMSRSKNWGLLTNMDVSNDWVVDRGQYAIDIDGANDFCDLGAVPPLIAATMSCWCKLRVTNPLPTRSSPPFAQDSSGFGSHYVWIDNKIYMQVLRTDRVTATPSPLVNRAAWHLFTIVNNGSRYQLYQNNILIHDSESTEITTNNFFIGKSVAQLPVVNTTYRFDGLVSDAILWNRGLNADEITKLYQLGRGGILQRRQRRRVYSLIRPTLSVSRSRASLITRPPIEPSYDNGFAPRDGEPLYPNLWRGLVGAWSPSLGPTGNRLLDWSGNKNHGTLTNMDPATDWRASPGGVALDFDGSNDYVNLGAGKEIAGDLTVSCWATSRLLDTGVYAIVASFDSTGGIGTFQVELFQGRWGFIWGSNPYIRPSTGVNITVNQWYHVVLTRKGLAGSWAYNLYIDGKNAITGTTSVNPAAAQPLAIGRNGDRNAQYWPGLIGDVGLWSRALTAHEVALLYQLGRGGLFHMRQNSIRPTSQLSTTWVKNNGEWKETEAHYIKQNGVWVPSSQNINISNNWR